MRLFSDINPFILFIYFIIVSFFPMFCENGIIYFISFLGAFSYFIFLNGKNESKTHFFYLILFLILTFINPIISHNGETVLLVINNSPITLEAFIYGFFSALLIVSILYWFRIFSLIMNTDKILYIFDKFSTKFALIISMSLRYIPLIKSHIKKINHGLKITSEYNNDNIIVKFKTGIRIFSSTVTWILENGIITAESMEARGYGIGKRSRYNNYPIIKADVFFGLISLILFFCSLLFLINVDFIFYPKFAVIDSDFSTIGYMIYLLLVYLPFIIDLKENVKWKYLERKI